MSATAQIDRASEEIIYELVRRVVGYRSIEFDRVWEAANKICDRYQVRKNNFVARFSQVCASKLAYPCDAAWQREQLLLSQA
jgi:hypothetical protein